MQLSGSLFWDVDFKDVDYDKYAQYIINRILLRGNLNDWFEIKNYYGLEKIKEEVVKMRYLDNRTLNFCSFYFDIPKTKFRCTKTPMSIRKLWNY
jgi:hypothetical protein